ncbi:MAG: FHA domain-containing protein, partial [Planctomycetes bacterium]|nr:FHA domain-containing protein [Planctomycetota bacterium]
MAYLEIVEGLSQESSVECVGEVSMGRAPSNRLCIPDSRASRKHAQIREENGGFFLSDNGSANGTFLNRGRINPEIPHPLKNGDEIVICGTRMIFRDDTNQNNAQPAASKGKPITENSMLSIVMTDKDKGPAAVNVSMDASISMVDIREEEKSSEKGLLEAVKRLQAMVKVSADLGAITGRDKLLNMIMDNIFDVFPQADRSFILLKDYESGQMVPIVGKSRQEKIGQQDEFPISKTIIKAVIEEKRSILSNDAQDDDRFSAQQSIVDLSIRALMCAPFIYKDEILGIINVDTMSRMDSFDSDDLAMLTGIAAQAAIAIKNTHLLQDIEKETQTRAQLSRYISPDVVEGVLDGSIPLQLGADKKKGTVFFCDIVGFTAMSEKMTAMEVVDKLNRYFCVTTEIVTRNKGTLHKFGGDMIMAFWNVLLPDERAEYNSVMTSLEMQNAVWAFDQDLISQDQRPIYLGIGVNTGEFAGGNIGGDRIEYTIIGDNVNLGQRIESMAGRWQVFVSESTYLPIKDECIAVGLPPVMVKGKSQPIKIYSIRGVESGKGELSL